MSWRPLSLNPDGDARGGGMTWALVVAQPLARRIGGLVGRRAHAGVVRRGPAHGHARHGAQAREVAHARDWSRGGTTLGVRSVRPSRTSGVQ
uniref:Uncharacterized protein n=1 Tax=Oryza meridionalis TaxID=40149 RepID=A0A0E0ES09_9ORYZ